MRRMATSERADWRELAERLGFKFHTIDGEPYWDESAYYQFTLEQIENDLEDPSEEIHAMCMDLVDRVVRDEALLSRLAIPELYWDYIRESWVSGQPHFYGRLDLAYDGSGPAKLYELNYDTPTSLYESAFFQWVWLEQAKQAGLVPAHADQFNSIQEKLIEVFQYVGPRLPGPLYFTSVRESEEDRGTVQYMQDCAAQAGVDTRYIAIEDIGASDCGRFVDLDDQVIEAIFKLYPWEFMFEEAFGPMLPSAGAAWFEPPWKAILSNKGVLPLLWEAHEGHPNLLPAYFEDPRNAPLQPGWVRKPFFSREGANVTLRTETGETVTVDGPYDDGPYVRQAYHALPRFEGGYTLIGSWIIGDRAAGIGIREDNSLITKDSSRFLPHVIV